MAKKNQEIKFNDIQWSLDDIMSDRFGRYSKYIIQERALPDARDGLKPVQRRILYAMQYDGNVYEKAHRKSAKTVGLVIGTFHPHGDTSVYDAMVRMSQDWKVNVPLIDMHGNNGSIDDDPAAAMRYTEARLSKYAGLMLQDIEKNTVPFTNNYDDSELEPTVLPASFPLLLVNGSTGIASGYATNIAPHNLHEVIDASIYRISQPNCSLDELMEFVKGPDFPTGGIVQGKQNIKEVFKTGKGKVVLRSKAEIVENRTNNQIIITEIPYEVVKSNLVKKIADIYFNKDIDGISDVRDESGRNGLKIVIDLKKDINPNLILNYLYKNTDLQINYNYNMIAIVDHRPVLLSLEMAIDAFLKHRKEVVLNRTKYLKDKKEARIHILEGLIKAISILDDVIELIRKSNDKADAKKRLMDAYLFTDAQAEAIVNLRLYRLSNTDIKILKEEYSTLISEIIELDSILNSSAVLNNLMIRELKAIKESHPYPRRTKIEDEVEEIVIDRLSMIANEQVYLSISKDGYIKRYSQRAYNANEGTLPSFKETDRIIGIKQCDTLDTLLIFTTKGNYAYIPVYTLEECKWKDLGKHISHYVKLEAEEKVMSAIVVKNFDTYAYILTVSRSGMIKKSLVKHFDVQRYSKVMTAMKLKKDDELIAASVLYSNDEILLVSKSGYYNRYSSEVFMDVLPRSQGVIGMNVKGDELAFAAVISDPSSALYLCNEKGGMKRIHLEELAITSRATKGIRLFKQTKTNPNAIKAGLCLKTYDTLQFYDGELKLLNAKDVPFMSIEATFSNPLSLNESFFFLQANQEDIQTVEIIDFPEDFFKKKEEYDQTSLFE